MATVAQPRSDNSVRDDVLRELKWDPKISSASDIAVAATEGVVTLSGFVPSYWQKDAAEKAVKRVYGVREIANDINVKLFWKRTDPEIARSAVHELESHVSIPAEAIQVTVKDGWVTLEGAVDWEYQKSLAHSVVKKLKGLTGVTNRIEVKPKVTPQEVKGKIEEALRRSAELNARRDQIRSDDSGEEPHKETYIRRASWPVGPAGRCLHSWRIDKLEKSSAMTIHVAILTAGVCS